MTVAFQRMSGILERSNNNQVMPSLIKPHELSYGSNISLSTFNYLYPALVDDALVYPLSGTAGRI